MPHSHSMNASNTTQGRLAIMSSHRSMPSLLLISMLAILSSPSVAEDPIQVFVLAGQSNMVGAGRVEA